LALLENEMWKASEALDFEKAAAVRDRIRELEARLEGREVDLPSIPGGAAPAPNESVRETPVRCAAAASPRSP
jgi:hypothetical protein